MLRIDGVSRSFGDVTALDRVSLEIEQGEFFALLGPSGCGKTTLLRILAGFETPDSGTATLDGADLLALAPNRRPINLMFQSYALFPHLSVAKNIAYGLERERLPRAEVKERVGEVLETVGLTAHASRRPQQLSGGQRQRVALARAIVKRPRLLLLDEPLSALDKKVRADMQLELKRLQNEVGITFVVVTHDQEEAMSLADRIAVFDSGRVRQVDRPVELYERPRSRFVADFVGANNLFDGTADADGGLVTGSFGTLRGTAVEELDKGAAALLAVRPEKIALREAAATPDGEATVPEGEETPPSEAATAPSGEATMPAEDAVVPAETGAAQDAEATVPAEDAGVPAETSVSAETGAAPDGDAAVDGEAAQDGEAVPDGLRGTVLDVSFYGGVSHLSVEVAGREQPVLVAVQGASTVTTGARVALSWDERDAVLLRAAQ
ncbi:ATP-binding cassette domain-containing protein [Nonomuraea longicatena]|uniref:ABC transporter domain-containing protein n=1 Tax=Nonomuraea longicatena TaxID=83682 RepID=A0ABP4A025_9ACTN